ncbi:glutathione S-transferase [Thozetella sp. PMI_491]|nr:glutathione S-transferase [Thozetella sp. PMI_491]
MASVDTLIALGTTGAARGLADAHSADHPLKLYGGWFCPFVQRAWIVLEEKGIQHQYVEINPYKKAPEFLALNPRGLVPTLAVPKAPKPLYESSVICEYLEDAFPDKKLLPVDPYERARCRLWIDHAGSRIVPAFYKLLQHTSDKAYSLDDARAELHKHLKTFAEEMEPGGPWFLGDKFSLIDIMLAPWAKRLFLIDHYKQGGTGIPARGAGRADEAAWTRWHQWFDAIVARQSVQATWSSDENYVDAYRRYAEDTTQSEVAKATRQGAKLP